MATAGGFDSPIPNSDCLPDEGGHDPKSLIAEIETVGAEHCIISTDFGQAHHPPTAEGIRMFIGLLLKNGVSENVTALTAKVNPSKLPGRS